LASILPSIYSRYGCSSISGIRRNSSSVIILPTRAGLAIVEPLFVSLCEPIRPRSSPVMPGRSTPTGHETVVPDLRSGDHAEPLPSVLQFIRKVEMNESGAPVALRARAAQTTRRAGAHRVALPNPPVFP